MMHRCLSLLSPDDDDREHHQEMIVFIGDQVTTAMKKRMKEMNQWK